MPPVLRRFTSCPLGGTRFPQRSNWRSSRAACLIAFMSDSRAIVVNEGPREQLPVLVALIPIANRSPNRRCSFRRCKVEERGLPTLTRLFFFFFFFCFFFFFLFFFFFFFFPVPRPSFANPMKPPYPPVRACWAHFWAAAKSVHNTPMARAGSFSHGCAAQPNAPAFQPFEAVNHATSPTLSSVPFCQRLMSNSTARHTGVADSSQLPRTFCELGNVSFLPSGFPQTHRTRANRNVVSIAAPSFFEPGKSGPSLRCGASFFPFVRVVVIAFPHSAMGGKPCFGDFWSIMGRLTWDGVRGREFRFWLQRAGHVRL